MTFLKVLSAAFNQCLEARGVTDSEASTDLCAMVEQGVFICSVPQVNCGDTGGHMGRGDEQVPGFPDRLRSQWLIRLQFIEMFLMFYPLLS